MKILNFKIDFLLRKGNVGLLKNHPKLNSLLVFDRKESKRKELIRLIRRIRKEEYDYVINPHRFLSSGLLTTFSKAKNRIGFKKNPLSFLFHQRYNHSLADGQHEIERNHQLISRIVKSQTPLKPRLYPSPEDFKGLPEHPYICVAPASVWFTKQYPAKNWIHLINRKDPNVEVHLLGGPNDRELCQLILEESNHPKIKNRAGELSFLQSAALISKAEMNYANDSAPLHFASAMNAPISAIFCSTLPSFGFGPLSDNSKIEEQSKKLSCRPCGIHGKKSCPEGHFECGNFLLD